MPPMLTTPRPPHPALEDLQAIDAMLTAARDHAAAVADAAAPGTAIRSRAFTLIQHLERASSVCTFMAIDLDPKQRIPVATHDAPPATAAAA